MAHNNTVFLQLLKLIPRHEFETLAKTNNFKLSAKTIVDIYKARWQVELFFKWIVTTQRIIQVRM